MTDGIGPDSPLTTVQVLPVRSSREALNDDSKNANDAGIYIFNPLASIVQAQSDFFFQKRV